MLIRKVSRMGKMKVVYVPTTDFSWGQKVSLKPKSQDFHLVKKVAKMGKHLLVIIPKISWEYFRHGSEVYIKEVGK